MKAPAHVIASSAETFTRGVRHYVAVKLADAYAATGDLRDRLAMLYRQAGRDKEADAVEAELRALLAVAADDHPIRRRLDMP